MTYSTSFPATENPISQSSNWINGLATGLDWTNCRTTPGLVFGTQADTGGFDDSTALLTGSWGNDQTIYATVSIVSSDGGQFEEVELRTRSALAANSCTGYEFLFGVKSGDPYVQIVRWNGALGDFTLLDARVPSAIVNGDVVKATSIGTTHRLYINGVESFNVTDATFASGKPGVGFYLHGGSGGTNSNYGFSSFTASDGIADSPPVPGRGRFNLATRRLC